MDARAPGSEAPRLGEILVADGVLSRADVARGLALARATGSRLGSALIGAGLVDADAIATALARQKGVAAARDKHLAAIAPATAALVPAELARRLCAIAVGVVRGARPELVVAMRDPDDAAALAELARATGMAVRPAVAAEARLRELVDALPAAGAGAGAGAELVAAMSPRVPDIDLTPPPRRLTRDTTEPRPARATAPPLELDAIAPPPLVSSLVPPLELDAIAPPPSLLELDASTAPPSPPLLELDASTAPPSPPLLELDASTAPPPLELDASTAPPPLELDASTAPPSPPLLELDASTAPPAPPLLELDASTAPPPAGRAVPALELPDTGAGFDLPPPAAGAAAAPPLELPALQVRPLELPPVAAAAPAGVVPPRPGRPIVVSDELELADVPRHPRAAPSDHAIERAALAAGGRGSGGHATVASAPSRAATGSSPSVTVAGVGSGPTAPAPSAGPGDDAPRGLGLVPKLAAAAVIGALGVVGYSMLRGDDDAGGEIDGTYHDGHLRLSLRMPGAGWHAVPDAFGALPEVEAAKVDVFVKGKDRTHPEAAAMVARVTQPGAFPQPVTADTLQPALDGMEAQAQRMGNGVFTINTLACHVDTIAAQPGGVCDGDGVLAGAPYGLHVYFWIPSRDDALFVVWFDKDDSATRARTLVDSIRLD